MEDDLISPYNFINTFQFAEKDTLLAGGAEEFNRYVNYPEIKAFCSVYPERKPGSDENISNEFVSSGQSLSGFKLNQTITLVDEEGTDFHVLTIDALLHSTTIRTKEEIKYKEGQKFIAEVYIQTRELYTDNPDSLNEYERGLFRYPYLPINWSSINPFGLVTKADRSDVKTFSSNVTVNWNIVVQDAVIEESFTQMDYGFLNKLQNIYSKQNLIGYRPRDLNLNLYLVEMLPLEIGKMNRYWADDIKIKYKVHKILNDLGYISNLSNIR